jgi:O-antigen ligase
MAIAIIFGLIRLIETDRAVRMSERIAAAGVVSVCTVAMFLSGTRTAWLAVGLALIFVLPIARTKALVRLAAASVVVVVAVSSLPQLVPMMDLRVSTAISSGGAGRVSIWADGIAIIERHPLAGVGFGGFPNAFAAQELGYEFDSLVPFTFGGIGRNPHSIYIRVLAETGLIGLILWLLFVGKLIAQSARRGIPSYLNLVMVVLMIVGVFQDVLLSKVFWLPLAYFAGLGASAHERPRVSEDEGNIWPGAKIS